MKLATFVNFSWNSVVIIYLVVKQCPSVPQWHATIESPILWELLHSSSFILSQTLSSIRLVLNMNRKLSNLMPAAANMVSNLGNRAGTGYDQVWKLKVYNEIRNLYESFRCVSNSSSNVSDENVKLFLFHLGTGWFWTCSKGRHD